jgi:hypothetical protein
LLLISFEVVWLFFVGVLFMSIHSFWCFITFDFVWPALGSIHIFSFHLNFFDFFWCSTFCLFLGSLFHLISFLFFDFPWFLSI